METGKWKVINRHPKGLTHREKFRDEQLVIPAGKFILMDYEDAVLFKGQMFPIKMDAMGVQEPSSYKVIHIEPAKEGEKPYVKPTYISNRDGKLFDSQAELDMHLKQFEDEQFTDENLEKQIATAKKKPGRPAKVQTIEG